MKNIKLLREKKKIRDLMLNFLISDNEIEFESALKLNNEIAENSTVIDRMEKYPYLKLQRDSGDYKIELPSKMNYNVQKDN